MTSQGTSARLPRRLLCNLAWEFVGHFDSSQHSFARYDGDRRRVGLSALAEVAPVLHGSRVIAEVSLRLLPEGFG